MLLSSEITRLFVALAVLLVVSRAMGEVARRLGQPSILGELVAGILLGPALFGRVAPEIAGWLFPPEGPTAVVLEGVRALAVVLFLLVAGLEVDLSTIFKRGRTALVVGVAGVVAPFALGALAAMAAPGLLGYETGADRGIFVLFLATALSISALPVIARTLMDLGLYRTEFGMVVIAAAMLNDLAGWVVFAAILGMAREPGAHPAVLHVVVLTLSFTVLMLTVARWAVHRALPWVQAHTAWPAGVLGFAIALALAAAATSEWIGIHAIFGAFLAGVALGDSAHLRERTRATIDEFVSSFFAPIFFASIGLKVDFLSHFDPVLVAAVTLLACVGKVLGCGLGARLAGVAPREAWAIGFALNARGSMGIILGLAALGNGVIGERMFVTLVCMALFTSVLSGPAIQRLMGRSKPSLSGSGASPPEGGPGSAEP